MSKLKFKVSLLQIVWLWLGLDTSNGEGKTVMLKFPLEHPEVYEITELDGPTGINDGMSPTPDAAKPIDGLLLVQENWDGSGTEIISVGTPLQNMTSAKVLLLDGIVNVTDKGYIPPQSSVKTVFPLITVNVIGTPVGKPK